MSKEEPAWRAEIKTALADAGAFCGECGFQPGDPGCPDCVRCWNWYADALAPHIRAAEQRGFQAGVNKTGDSVGKLRAKLAQVRRLSENWAVLRTHGGAAYELRAVLDDPDKP